MKKYILAIVLVLVVAVPAYAQWSGPWGEFQRVLNAITTALTDGTRALSVKSITTSGNATIGGRAYVDSLSNPAGALVIPDSLTVTGNLTSNGSVQAGATSNGQFYGAKFWGYDTGTATNPTFNFGADANLGIYRIGPDRLAIAAKGADVAIADSAGVDVTGRIKLSKFLRLTPKAATSDTTGMAGGECWYSTGDTLYVYKSDHTIGVIFP